MNNIQNMVREFISLGIRCDAFCVPGQYPSDNTYVIESLPMDRYTVYYFERGCRIDEIKFDIEESAIANFRNRILKDISTRK